MDNHGSATLAPGYEAHAGLTLAEAAAHLGISKDATRRRLKSGKLAGHQVAGAHGPEWCCHPEQPGDDRQGSATPAHTVAPPLDNPGATVAQPADVAALVAMLDRTVAENGELREKNGQVHEEASAWKWIAMALAVQLSDAQDRLAITAPSEPKQEAATATVSPPASVESPVPRWRRLWPLALALAVVVALALLLAWPR